MVNHNQTHSLPSNSVYMAASHILSTINDTNQRKLDHLNVIKAKFEIVYNKVYAMINCKVYNKVYAMVNLNKLTHFQ